MFGNWQLFITPIMVLTLSGIHAKAGDLITCSRVRELSRNLIKHREYSMKMGEHHVVYISLYCSLYITVGVILLIYSPNISLVVRKRLPIAGGDNTVESSIDTVITPILEHLRDHQESFPKTLVYMPLAYGAHAHDLASRILGTEGWPVAQYTAPQSDQVISTTYCYYSYYQVKKSKSKSLIILTYGMG